MIKLTSALNQKLVEAYYNWNADNNMYRFDCVIDVGYLAEPLRKIMMRSKDFNATNGTIVLNLSVNACRHIDYSGDCFYGEIAFSGMPTRLHLPWHSFIGVNVQISENASVFSSFPNVDRILFDAENPTYVHPFRDIANGAPGTVSIDIVDVMAWLAEKGITDVPVEKALEHVQHMVSNDDDLFSQFLSYVSERANTRKLKELEETEDFIANQPGVEVSPIKKYPELKVVDKPLLDFGDLPGAPVNVAPSRYKGKPKLTVIKGGKK
ncbi:hypothetical protein RVBP21_1410 [Pseudomonas phage BRkr]|nr:hypothetical protein RVBP21_1410 [Pseudomonas phage BRkr]